MNVGGVAGSRSSHRRVTAVEVGPGAVAMPAASIGGGGSARNMRWGRGSRPTSLEIIVGMVIRTPPTDLFVVLPCNLADFPRFSISFLVCCTRFYPKKVAEIIPSYPHLPTFLRRSLSLSPRFFSGLSVLGIFCVDPRCVSVDLYHPLPIQRQLPTGARIRLYLRQ